MGCERRYAWNGTFGDTCATFARIRAASFRSAPARTARTRGLGAYTVRTGIGDTHRVLADADRPRDARSRSDVQLAPHDT